MIKMTLISIAALSCLLLSGCTAVVVGAGEKAYTHLRGDLLGIVPDKLDEVYQASLSATDKLTEYHRVDQKLTAIGAEITAYDHNADKLIITLSRTESDQTRIQIRIGAFGDKVKSVFIYDCIQRELKTPQTAHAVF